MCLVAKHIIEAHEIHRELVRIEEAKVDSFQMEAATQWTYKNLTYCDENKSRKLDFKSSITMYSKIIDKYPQIPHIEKFLRSRQICEVSDDGPRPITWLELYIIYRIK